MTIVKTLGSFQGINSTSNHQSLQSASFSQLNIGFQAKKVEKIG